MTLEQDVEAAGKDSLFQDTTELGEVMKALDEDSTDDKGNSKLDFNTRLSDGMITSTLVMEEFSRMGLLPGIDIHNKNKRLRVSHDGKGRREKVEVTQGTFERRSGSGFVDKFKAWVSPGK